MKQIDIPMLLLALLVVSMFALSGIVIYYGNFWLVTLCLLLGFVFMGVGLTIKRKRETNKQ